MLDLIFIILFCAGGVLVGIVTGILPGLHVNNIALILLSLAPTIAIAFGFFSNFGFDENFIMVLICVFIIGVSTSHTFHDMLPSTFLGAPDEDTALSILPAHSLLLEGRGYEAVALSAIGSYGAILTCFALLFPIRFILGPPLSLYKILKEIMVFVLIAISILMIATEKARIEIGKNKKFLPSIIGILFAFFVFLLSGIFGIVILNMQVESPIGLSSPILFPALSGLFGMSTLITSLLTKPKIPKQVIEEPRLDKKARKSSILSVLTGSLGGILVSIIPGITSATGTIIAMTARGETDKRQTILTLSAVNTACAFFVTVVLFIILRARSGAAIAIAELVAIDQWTSLSPPKILLYFLIAMLIAGTLSYFSTLKLGKLFAKHFSNVPYALLIKIVIVFIVILVFLFTGLSGLLVLTVATFIGLLPVEWGIRRSHCMGVLLIPIIIYFL